MISINELPREPIHVKELENLRSQLCIYASALIGDAHRAEDLVHETFVIYLSAAEDKKPSGNLEHWLKGVLRNLALKEGRRIRYQKISDTLARTIATKQQALNEAAARTETNLEDALSLCRARLNPTDEKLLVLRYQEKLSINEISASLNKNLSSVKVALHRIRLGLKNCIESKLKKSFDHS